MAGAVIDHLISLMVFLGALLLFISLFNQTIQTAIVYQHHRVLAAKCSDLLDNMLLNPGVPWNWGTSNVTPTGFGLQDPDSAQYKLSPFSLMRLQSAVGEPVYYPKTGQYYGNITIGFGNFLLVPLTEAINYSVATSLLGINESYGFKLTLTPTVTVSISKSQSNPLTLVADVEGAGFPLSNANLSYLFIEVEAKGGQNAYPSFTTTYGSTYTNAQGLALLTFPDVNGEDESYVLIAYAHLSGLMGVGYYKHVTHNENYVVPFISDFGERTVIIAHSYDVHRGDNPAEIAYNATFILVKRDYTLSELRMENSTENVGKINYGEGKPYKIIKIPTYDPGILVITYRKSAVETGVVLMPWGISSLAFPVVFRGAPSASYWVATDIRQVLVNGAAYQAKLALWSLQGYGVSG